MVVVSAFVLAVFLGAAAVEAASAAGKIVLTREGKTPSRKAVSHEFNFADPESNGEICAEGYCTCTTCVCWGSQDCCDIGCAVCWWYIDSTGGCNAT